MLGRQEGMRTAVSSSTKGLSAEGCGTERLGLVFSGLEGQRFTPNQEGSKPETFNPGEREPKDRGVV